MEPQMDSNLVEEIWTSISHYVPERQKIDCAVDYVKTLIDQGVEHSTLKAAMEYDEKLTEGIKIVLADEVDDSYGLEDNEDENNWHEE